MKRNLLSVALLGAVLIGGAAQAKADASQDRKLVQTVSYRDNMGQTNVNHDSYFYDAQGRLQRAVLYFSTDDVNFVMQTRSTYNYDTNGNLTSVVKEKATPTTADNVANEFTFEYVSKTEYGYDDNNNRIWEQSYNYMKALPPYRPEAKWNTGPRYEWQYNDAGQKTTQLQYYTYKEDATNTVGNTTTYTYNAEGQCTLEHNDGQYPSNKWNQTNTYNADGQVTQNYKQLWVLNADTDQEEPGHFVESYDYTYTDGLLNEVLKKVYNSTAADGTINSTKTVYEMVNGNRNVIQKGVYNWNTTDNAWNTTPVATSVQTDYYQDFTAARQADFGAVMTAAVSPTAADDVILTCTIPAAMAQNTANKVVIYRDSAPVLTSTLADLGDSYDAATGVATITIAKNPLGVHNYFAQYVEVTADAEYGWAISEVIPLDIAIQLPTVLNPEVTSVTREAQHVDADPEQGVVEHDYYTYNVELKWTNIDAAQRTDLGLKRIEVFLDQQQAAYITLAATSLVDGEQTAKLTALDDGSGTLTIRSIYEQGTADNEPLTFAYADETPVEVYGFITGSGAPQLVKMNLTDTSAATVPYETIWDLSDQKGTDTAIEEFSMGCSAGDYYYGYYATPDGDMQFGAFNFTDKTITNIGGTIEWGTPFANVQAMTYSADEDVIYAVCSTMNAARVETNEIYRLNPVTNESELVGPAPHAYKGIAMNGDSFYGLYLTDDNTRTWAIETVDAKTLATQPINLVTSPVCNPNFYRSFVLNDGKLYMTMLTASFEINPHTGATITLTPLTKALTGATLTMSTKTPEGTVAPEPEAGSRVLVSTSWYGDVMGYTPDTEVSSVDRYFYNNDFKELRATSTNSAKAEGDLTAYYEKTYNANGDIVNAKKLQPGTDDYGFAQFNTIEETVYTYNDQNQLTEKSVNNGEEWSRYTYVTDPNESDAPMGALLTETYGQGNSTHYKLEYMYNGQDDPNLVAIHSQTVEHPEWTGNNWVDFYQYNQDGTVATITRYSDMQMSATIWQKQYEYFEGTQIQKSLTTSSYDEESSALVPERRVISEMENGDRNAIMCHEESYFEGQWYNEGGTKHLDLYADYSSMKDNDPTEIFLTEGATNSVSVNFILPAYTDGHDVQFNLYRNGEIVKSIAPAELNNYLHEDAALQNMVVRIPQENLFNGEYDFFVAPVMVNLPATADGQTTMQMPISNAIDKTLATKFPAVTDLKVVECVKTDTEANATIGWTNPENMAQLGFVSNEILVAPIKVADLTVNDPAVNEAKIDLTGKANATITILTRYNLGYALSEPLTFKVESIEDAALVEGLNLRVVGDIATTSQAADIDVFDMSGARVATAQNATVLCLKDLKGAYIIVARNAKAHTAVKAVL